MRTALITGGAGFIGSHVTDGFLAEGWDVTILDNFSTGRRENVPLQARVVEAPIESPAAAKLLGETVFDAVIHCAAQLDVRRSVADPLYDAQVNVLGTLNLLQALHAAGRNPRFILASTGGVLYGDFTAPPNVETFPKDPDSPYGVSKLASEYYLSYYARVHELDAVALRLGNVYGPRQDPRSEAGVVAIFCARIIAGEPLVIYGTGEQTRDYIYVSDVVRAFQLAATRELPAAERLDSRAFNIGTGAPTTVNQIAEKLQRAAGTSRPVRYAPERAGELLNSCLSVEKAAAEIGWRPLIPLDDGLKLTYDWFRHVSET